MVTYAFYQSPFGLLKIGIADEKGSLTPGKDADIVLLDNNCRVLKTIVRGVCKYSM